MKLTNTMRGEVVDAIAKQLYAKRIEEAEKALKTAGGVVRDEVLRRVGVFDAFKALPEHWFERRSNFRVQVDDKDSNFECEYAPVWNGATYHSARNHKGEEITFSSKDDPCVVAYQAANDTLKALKKEDKDFREELGSSLASITTDVSLQKQMPHVWEVFNRLYPKPDADAGLPAILYKSLDDKIAEALNKLTA
jgi:hypothetical protein